MAIATHELDHHRACMMQYACTKVPEAEQHTLTHGPVTICKHCVEACLVIFRESEDRENARMVA